VRRNCFRIIVVLSVSVAWAQPAATAPTPLTGRERFHIYLRQTFGPVSVAQSALGAGINQWLDAPPEWGQGMEGYGHRFVSACGRSVIDHSIQSGVAAMRGEDPRYWPSGRKGVRPRTRYAIIHTFMSRTDDGGETLAISTFAGVYGGWMVARTWYPDKNNNVSFALEHASISMAVKVGTNVFQEFWPDIRRKVFRK
jgi:hypothetical protein